MLSAIIRRRAVTLPTPDPTFPHETHFAGRSYRDLSQYPVFPWVLSDYTSTTLDLDDRTVYRDLAKPMGALTPARRDRLFARYQHMRAEHDAMPAFMYGSHYSNPGTVIFYLLRLPPYCCAALDLQGGKFDFADRLFHRHVFLTSPAGAK